MSKNIVLDKKQQFLVVFLSVVLSLLVVWAAASGATTISTNISTGGTLTVTGVSTLTGVATLDGGALLTASSTAVGKFQVNGALNASSSIYVLGDARFDSGVGLGAANSVAKTLLWSALTSNPSGSEGMVYYNSSSKLLKLYDGTSWINVATSSMTGGLAASGNRVQLSDISSIALTFGTTTNWTGASLMTLQATSSATVPLTIYSAASQTTNLLQLMSNVDTELFAVDAAGMASTTGLSVTTGGGLWVGGNATTSAQSGNIATAGTLSVTGTSAFTGKTTHTAGAILVASSTAVNNFTVAGELHASSTLEVTGAATFNNSLTTATSSATTTIAVRADSNPEGGCLQLTAQNGKLYRMYITAADATVFATTTGRGSGTQISAVWELGGCQ